MAFDGDVHWPGVAALGIVVGFVSGMFGVGGGFLLTPLLSVVFKIPMPIAVGTGLCQMVGTSTVASLRHRKLGQGEGRFALVLVAGSLLGVTAGARVVAMLVDAGTVTWSGRSIPISTLGLYGAYISFLGTVAAILYRQSVSGFNELEYVRRGPLSRIRLPPYISLPNVPMQGVSVLVIAYLGLGLGFISGLLGVGGGIALIPLLLYGYGFPFRQAAGTGIVVTLLTSVVGTVAHALAGHVYLPLAMVLLMGAGISAQFGAIATRRLPARILRKGLAGLVLLTCVAIVWDLVGQLRG